MSLLNNATGLYVGAWVDPATNVVHYLRDTSGAHIGAMGPTGSGKLLSWLMPNLLSCLDSMFIYDPKGELWQLTAGWRRSIGQNVLRYKPGDAQFSCGFNFLDEIRLTTDYEVADAQNLAVMLIDQDGKGFGEGNAGHFNRAAFGFLSGLILHVMHTARRHGETTSLPAIAVLLSSPKVDPLMLCRQMAASPYGAMINAAGVDQLKRDSKERDAVLSSTKTHLSLFLDPVIARNCSHSSFHFSDLMDHRKPTSLYLEVPGTDTVRLRPITRMFITLMVYRLLGVDLLFDAEQRPVLAHKRRMVLLLEEFPDLGKLALFEKALAIMRGAGMTAFLVMQDKEQLMKEYGEHQTILANLQLIAAFAPNEIKTAEWLSKELGPMTVNLEQYTASGKPNAWPKNLSHSFSSFSHPLMTPAQIRRMKTAKKNGTRIIEAGEMLILPTGERPIFGRQILFFEDDVFVQRAKLPPPDFSDNLVAARAFTMPPRETAIANVD